MIDISDLATTDAAADTAGIRAELMAILGGELPIGERLQAALERGRTYLEMDTASLTRIHADTDHREVVVSTGPDGENRAGHTADLADTYCQQTVESETTLAIQDAPGQGLTDDLASRSQGRHCYLGLPVTLDGECYGTVCFTADQPRDQPFTETDRLVAELLGTMIEHQLELGRREIEQQRQTTLNGVLSRVLRHTLRNELTVIRGNLADSARLAPAQWEAVLAAMDTLVEISDKSRKLDQLTSVEFTRTETDISKLIHRVVQTVGHQYTGASFAIDLGDEITIPVLSCLEQALVELIENAAKHNGDSPCVAITVESAATAVRIHIRDDGPGLSAQQRQVLQDGAETPLVQGSGLGLWTANWIVSAHDGHIETDVSQAGSEVTITLPRTISDPLATRGSERRDSQGTVDRYEAAFEGAFDALLVLDEAAAVLDANSAACGLFGHDRTDLVGRSVAELLDDVFQTDDDLGRTRTRITRPDGSERLVEYTATWNNTGGHQLVVARDITDAEANKATLERTRDLIQRARTLAAVTGWELDPDPVVVLDREGRVTEWNGAAEAVFGWSADEVVGHPPPMVPETAWDAFQLRLEQVLDGTSHSAVPTKRRTKNGTLLDVTVSTAPIHDENGLVTGAMIALSDASSTGSAGDAAVSTLLPDPEETTGTGLVLDQSIRELVGLSTGTGSH